MKAMLGKMEHIARTNRFVANTDFRRTYDVSSLILIFFIFAGIGWMWEVALHIGIDGMIINRGFLTGPWLPIYGVGAVMILTVLRKWQGQPLRLFGIIMLVSGTMEYITSFTLEKLFGAVWWDYSDLTFQLQGRVSLAGLLIFGVGGLLLTYVGAPALDTQIKKMAPNHRAILCTCLLILFVGDFICSCIHPNMGFGITK